MKKSRIEAKPKEVEYIILSDGGLVTKPGIDLTRFADNILDIREHIVSGRPLPEHYYRRSVGPDHLLGRKGWLHLHVGHDIDDNVLLVVEQTADKVIFIAVTDHEIFDEKPLAKSLRGLGSKITHVKLRRSSPTPAFGTKPSKPKPPRTSR